MLALVEVVYHLFGGVARHRIHPHVERSIRLKTKSAGCVPELQTAYTQVRHQAVQRSGSDALCDFGKRSMNQRDLRGLIEGFQLLVGPFERRGILIEANQMSRCAEAFCDFVTVSAQAHRGIQISSATLYG